jgi:hypothetical protein
MIAPEYVAARRVLRDQPSRLKPKDGLDVLRLLRKTNAITLAAKLRMLASHDMAGEVTTIVIDALREHGADRTGPIAILAAAATPFDGSVTINESTVILIEELLEAYDAASLT